MDINQFLVEKLDCSVPFDFRSSWVEEGLIEYRGIVGNCYLNGRAINIYSTDDCPNLILVPVVNVSDIDHSSEIVAMSKDEYNDLPWDPCDDFARIRAAGVYCGWEF